MNIGCFVSLASTRNLAVTAAQLNVSKASILQNIKRLEEYLNLTLFITTSPDIRLTDAGKKFVEFFSTVGEEISNARSSLSRAKDGPELSVGWSEYTGCPDWVKRAIAQYRSENPEINFLAYQASPQRLLSMLSSRKVDIAISSRYLMRRFQGSFRTTALQELPMHLVVAIGSVYADMSAREIFALDTPFFASYAWEKDEADVIRRVEFECLRQGHRPCQTRVLPNQDSVYIMVRLGNGFTISPLNEKLRASGLFLCKELSHRVTLCMISIQPYAMGETARFENFLEKYAADREDADQ